MIKPGLIQIQCLTSRKLRERETERERNRGEEKKEEEEEEKKRGRERERKRGRERKKENIKCRVENYQINRETFPRAEERHNLEIERGFESIN